MKITIRYLLFGNKPKAKGTDRIVEAIANIAFYGMVAAFAYYALRL